MTARRAGWALAGAALVAAGLTGTARAPAAAGDPATGDVSARLGVLTVRATALRPGAAGTLTAGVRVTISGRGSDQLDAAIADGVPVGIYHEVISLADMPGDLASCGGVMPSSGVVDQWMHYGPLVVDGTSSGTSAPADGTLAVPRGSGPAAGAVTVTLYFAHAGPLVLRLPVSGR